MWLADLQLVVKIAEFKSISAAANSLDLQVAAASAALKRVEKQLGVELFIRSTRQLRLSAAGERFIPQCAMALASLAQAQHAAQDSLGQVSGELRVALSSDLGRNVVLPWLDELLEAQPNLRLRLHFSDSNIDFYRDPVDIAIRYGTPHDSQLWGYKLCDVPRVLCAAPSYLAQVGYPETLAQLPNFNALCYQLHDVIHDQWQFVTPEGDVKIAMNSDRVSNDADVVRRWCVAGKGIAAKSVLDMAEDLLAKRVVALLPHTPPKPSELWLVCPSRQSITPAVRLLKTVLSEKCAQLLMQVAPLLPGSHESLSGSHESLSGNHESANAPSSPGRVQAKGDQN